MEIAKDMILIIALLSLIIVCGYLIQFLQEAKKSISNLVQIAHKVENTTKPAIDQLQTTLVDTSQTLQSVQKQLSTIDDTLNQFKEIAQRVNELEAKLQQKIEMPLILSHLNSKKNNIMCFYKCPHLVCKTEWGLYFLLSYSYPNHELRAITECL